MKRSGLLQSLFGGLLFCVALYMAGFPELSPPSGFGSPPPAEAPRAPGPSEERVASASAPTASVLEPPVRSLRTPQLDDDSPWSSPAACLRALERGARKPSAERRTARIGTWNIRWYPDGKPGKKAASPGVDISWLACTMALIDVDVLAVQEMKTLPRAQARTSELLAELGRLTEGRWRAAFDDCPELATQHVGLLWNETRVSVSDLATEPSLNPHGAPCQDSLRPGFAGRFRFESGLDVQVVSVHFKSGTNHRSLLLRQKSTEALASVLGQARTRDPAAQVIFAGDFNTMGCSGCSPKVPAEAEQRAARDSVEAKGLAWLPNEPGCTEYYRGKGALLDGFVLSSELVPRVSSAARVSGLCGELACAAAPWASDAPAIRRLSDHCPVVLELSGE